MPILEEGLTPKRKKTSSDIVQRRNKGNTKNTKIEMTDTMSKTESTRKRKRSTKSSTQDQ